jgi:hypothetical protein
MLGRRDAALLSTAYFRQTRANFNEMHVFFQNVFQSFTANAENQKKSFRVKESWHKRRAELRSGKATRQRLPCWLIREKTVDASGKVIVGAIKVDEIKASTVREIFKLTLAGWSITKHFTENGVPVIAQGTRWNGRSLAATILTNPSVIGHYRMLENKKPRGEFIKNVYPAIIDERTFYACQKQVSTLQKLTTRNGAISVNIATGLCKCPTCGGNLSRHRSHAPGKVYSYLICGRTRAGSNETDCRVRPNYDAFEASLLGLLSHSETVQKALGQASAEPSKIAALSGQVAEADKQAGKILRLIEGDDAPAKSLVARLKALETQAETLRLELQSEEARAKASTSPQTVYETFKAELRANSQTPEGRERIKAAIREIVEQIQFIDKTTYMVQFKGGFKVCVCMPESGFKWETMEQIGGPLSVP